METGHPEIVAVVERTLDKALARLGGERRINYDLDRFREALKATGNPQDVVHTLVIGGTNGKGSTALFLSSTLALAGHRTGTYLSPHLQDPRERFLLNLSPVAASTLDALAAEFVDTAETFQLTYFEFLTLLAFHWAKRERLEFLVLEVGLGGRLDATNVTQPLASVITNIALDHQQFLGDTLDQILDEKLGILRREGLLFTGIREPHLLDRVERRCLDLDAIYYFAKELKVETGPVTWGGQNITLNGYPFTLSNPSAGTVENAALAFLTLRIVFPRIPVATLQAAFRAVRTPGRMEVVGQHPRVVLSGDHNPAGIECLKKTLEQLDLKGLHVLCGFSLDKPYGEMYAALKEISDTITLTRLHHHPAELPAEYRDLACVENDSDLALRRVLNGARREDTVLVTGSLYLIGELRKLWREEVSFLDTVGRGWERPSPFPGAPTPAKPRAEEATQNPFP